MGRAGKESFTSGEVLKQPGHIVIFHGPEGAGKSEQARLYAQSHGFPLIVVGDFVRRTLAEDATEFGDICRQQIAEKSVLDKQTLAQLLLPELTKEEYKRGFVVDGGIRAYEQVEGFDEMLEVSNRQMPVTLIYLRIPGWQSYERLVHGRKRADDTEELLLKRLTRHFDKLGSTMSLARKKWNFMIIDAGKGKSIQEIHTEIQQKERQVKGIYGT